MKLTLLTLSLLAAGTLGAQTEKAPLVLPHDVTKTVHEEGCDPGYELHELNLTGDVYIENAAGFSNFEGYPICVSKELIAQLRQKAKGKK